MTTLKHELDRARLGLREKRINSNVVSIKSIGEIANLAFSATTWTWQAKLVCPVEFSAIRLVHHNYSANVINTAQAVVATTETASIIAENGFTDSENISQPIVGGIKYDALNTQAAPYGWRDITWNGAANPSILAGTGTDEDPAITASDWIPCKSVPRTDGGDGFLAMYRFYIDGATESMTYIDRITTDDMKSVTAANRGRILQFTTDKTGNSVTSTTRSVNNISNLLLPVTIEFLTDVKANTLMAVGDSTMANHNQTADQVTSWAYRATASAGYGLINMGSPGESSDTYTARMEVALALYRPTVVLIQGLTTNDGVGTDVLSYARKLMISFAHVTETIDLCRGLGIEVIVSTGPLFETLDTARDTERKAQVAKLKALSAAGLCHLIDTDNTWSDGATPARYKTGYDSGDGLHPNETAIEAAAIDLEIVLMSIKELP